MIEGIIGQLRVYLGCLHLVIVSVNVNNIFCMNCLQSFPTETSRDKHFEYFKDNETVRIKMPEEGSLVKFQDGQNQFKVPFIMYANFAAILEPIESLNPNPESSYTNVISQHIPSGFCVNSKFA